MEPSFKHGQYVASERITYLFKYPAVGDAVIAQLASGRKIIKRISGSRGDGYFLKGDNFGKIFLDRKFILAKVLL